MKAIDNTYDLVQELKKGKKSIGVTSKFYNWLKANIKTLKYEKDKPTSASYCGVTIYVEKE